MTVGIGMAISSVRNAGAEISGLEIGFPSLLSSLWALTTGDPEICVAVLDGPADLTHPCFDAARIDQMDAAGARRSVAGAATVHGTKIASVLFGRSAGGIQGVAPRCRGLIIPIFEDNDAGMTSCSQVDLARAVANAIVGGAHVINVSGGHLQGTAALHPLLARELETCARRQILIVASTGNDGCACIRMPAAMPSVLAVGAMDSAGVPLAWSNWGPHYDGHGILAPGEGIPVLHPDGHVVAERGTSFATAIVSGVVALFLSLQRQMGLRPNPHAVRDALLRTAIACEDASTTDCRRFLAGRLSVNGALSLLLQGASGMCHQLQADTDPGIQGSAEVDERSFPPSLRAPLMDRPSPASTSAAMKTVSAASHSCGCQTKQCSCDKTSQPVYALGRLGYDFGTEARRDSIQTHMGAGSNPYDPAQLLAYLEKNPWDAADVIWTLTLDSTPIYAIRPTDAFAGEALRKLREFLAQQQTEGVERVSVPGWVTGRARLLSGLTVPVVQPVIRGMYSWTARALVEAIHGEAPKKGASESDRTAYVQRTEGVTNFLRRVYDELRNLGITSPDRALNYSATNALLVGRAFQDAVRLGMELDTITVESSPIARPGSDCWDVKLTFFDPTKVLERARKVYACTVDVSDSVPVMVGELRSWSLR